MSHEIYPKSKNKVVMGFWGDVVVDVCSLNAISLGFESHLRRDLYQNDPNCAIGTWRNFIISSQRPTQFSRKDQLYNMFTICSMYGILTVVFA